MLIIPPSKLMVLGFFHVLFFLFQMVCSSECLLQRVKSTHFPQVSQKEKSAVTYQCFSCQLFHACLTYVYSPLKPAMTTPEVVQCPDGHFRCAIFLIGPYITDYPEQVWLTATVQNWCPKYVIYQYRKSSSDVLLCRCDAQPDHLDDPTTHLHTH